MSNSSFPVGYLSQGTSSSAPTVKKTVTQANAFATNDVLYYTGSAYAKAQANVFSTSGVVGVVESATGADFVLVTAGDITMSGLTAGSIHYLDASTPGALTTTEPAISVPVLIATSTTTAMVIIDQPESTGTTYAADGGAANAYTVTLSPAPTAYTTGMRVYMKAANANTTNSTLNVNALGTKNIFYKGSGTLAANIIRASEVFEFIYDGTQFHIIGNELHVGTVTSLTISGGIEAVSASPITTADTIRGAHVLNAQSGTTDTVADDDRGKLITWSNTAAVAVTLPQAGASSNFISGWYVDVECLGTGPVTITPTTSTIDGLATLKLQQYQGCRIFSDGTNYFTMRGNAGAPKTDFVRLGSDFTTASASLVDVTGMAFATVAGRTYYFKMFLLCGPSARGQFTVALTFPAGTMSAMAFGTGDRAAPTTIYTERGHIDTTATSTVVFNAVETIYFNQVIGSFVCTTTGTVQLQINKSGGAASPGVEAGSFIEISSLVT